MFELRVVSHFAAAHQLEECGGGCERLHGHNWKVEVYVAGPSLGEQGLLVDFRVIKDATERVVKALDHQFLNELTEFKGVNPSSENIARHIFRALSRELNTENYRVNRVTAWESESACATYQEE
ncbi:MAG: 6-carboxytetrahydropterin synthase QueD [Deltaproteobacteria bacterium]|nr:6-carboxytetrahydropterin synthase QueD [Deltaproteobacteria bacterium]